VKDKSRLICHKMQVHRSQAMHLRIDAGFQNVSHMSQDEDLEYLRTREDFKKLISESNDVAVSQEVVGVEGAQRIPQSSFAG
jgi:hypothetical protein